MLSFCTVRQIIVVYSCKVNVGCAFRYTAVVCRLRDKCGFVGFTFYLVIPVRQVRLGQVKLMELVISVSFCQYPNIHLYSNRLYLVADYISENFPFYKQLCFYFYFARGVHVSFSLFILVLLQNCSFVFSKLRNDRKRFLLDFHRYFVYSLVSLTGYIGRTIA